MKLEPNELRFIIRNQLHFLLNHYSDEVTKAECISRIEKCLAAVKLIPKEEFKSE